RPADLISFNRRFGLPPLPRGSMQICTGIPRRAPGCAYNPTGSDEISLDVQYAHATAPGARILSYMAASASNIDFLVMYNTIVGGGGARQARTGRGSTGWIVTTSWGTCEPALPRAALMAYETIVTSGTAIGQTWVAASGDDGSRACYDMPTVDFPASSPHVI